MLRPLFRDVTFANLAKSKKPATVSVRIYGNQDDLVYVQNKGNKNMIVGYTDPATGLFHSDIKDAQTSNKRHHPYTDYRNAAAAFAEKAIDTKIEELSRLEQKDSAKYSNQYKPLKQIENELSDYLTDKHEFYADIQKQVNGLISRQLPHINEYLVYKDDVLDGSQLVTDYVPYNNPMKQTVTNEQIQLVDKVLDVFFDQENKSRFMWYFGAVCSNIDLQDTTITKVLLITSTHGGSGKSTLINALADNVITSPYVQIDSGFDKNFRAGDKFSTSNLPTCRLGIYSEAYFNGETRSDLPHDFSGLEQSEMKSWITEGYVANEKKYADKQIAYLTGLQVLLTNHPPEIDPKRVDLSRRFLGVLIKSGDMARKKAKQLGMDKTQFEAYIKTHAQAFANVFVDAYQKNPTKYQSYVYSTDRMATRIQQEELSALQKQTETSEYATDPLSTITALCNEIGIDASRLLSVIILSKTQHQRDDIRWLDDTLYLSSKRAFYVEFGVAELREELHKLCGGNVKKFSQRMFELT